METRKKDKLVNRTEKLEIVPHKFSQQCPTKEQRQHNVERIFVDKWYETSGHPHAKHELKGFPCGSVVNNQPQRRRPGFDPWSGKIPHASTKPAHHNYWTYALEPRSCSYWANVSQVLKPEHPKACAWQEKPLQWKACTSQLEKSLSSNEDRAQTKIN